MTNETEWARWWAARSEDERARLKSAAVADNMDVATAQFVLDTNPPIGLFVSPEPGPTSMSPSLRVFIQTQR